MKKYKAIAIPVCLAEDRPVFLTIRDRRWKDWGFVAGGSRRREVNCPLRTALRELEEETRGTVCLRSGEYTSYVFTVKESPTVELVYNVYVFFVNFTKTQRAQMVKKFMGRKGEDAGEKTAKTTHQEGVRRERFHVVGHPRRVQGATEKVGAHHHQRHQEPGILRVFICTEKNICN
jgi:hypothetical protein